MISESRKVAQRDDGYQISTHPDDVDRERVHIWLSTDAYWALGRSRSTADQAVDHSLNFSLLSSDNGQVGYARVVTDNATFAWLCDVYVARAARGLGLGTWLVRTVRDHLAPLDLKRIVLATIDAHGLYQQFGFEPLEHPERWMILSALAEAEAKAGD